MCILIPYASQIRGKVIKTKERRLLVIPIGYVHVFIIFVQLHFAYLSHRKKKKNI